MQAGSLLVKPASQQASRLDYFRSLNLIIILHFKLHVNRHHYNTSAPQHPNPPLPTMSYKTNYELYVSNIHALLVLIKITYIFQSRGSIDSRRSPTPPDELLSPLATLYPHVAALQPQYNPSNCTFTDYRDTGYWAAAYTTRAIDDSSSMRRINGKFNHSFFSVRFSSNIALDGRPCRFVSRLRRLLSRDDLRYRRESRATARTARTASLSFILFPS